MYNLILHRIHNIIKTLKVNMDNNYLLILFYSASGSVRNLAHAIADGAEEKNIKVKIRTVPKVSSTNEKVDPEVLIQMKFIVRKMI